MKTKFPEKIISRAECQKFWYDLKVNDELFHPEEDITELDCFAHLDRGQQLWFKALVDESITVMPDLMDFVDSLVEDSLSKEYIHFLEKVRTRFKLMLTALDKPRLMIDIPGTSEPPTIWEDATQLYLNGNDDFIFLDEKDNILGQPDLLVVIDIIRDCEFSYL